MSDPIGDIVAVVVIFLLFIFPVMKIIHRAGYSRLWVLVAFVPLANLIFFWVFAFSRWPIEDRLKQAQRAAESRNPAP